MDPLTAALLAYTKTIELILAVWNSMDDTQKKKVIDDWQANQDFWRKLFEGINKPV
jgi:hypothetical protein